MKSRDTGILNGTSHTRHYYHFTMIGMRQQQTHQCRAGGSGEHMEERIRTILKLVINRELGGKKFFLLRNKKSVPA